MKKLLISFGGSYKLGYFGGHFYTVYGFFKSKVQNGNVFWGITKFQVFCSFRNKIMSYFFSYNVCSDVNVTETH